MSETLSRIDTALIGMRHLWAPTTSGRSREGADAGVDMSTVLVVTAIGADTPGSSVAEVAERLGVAPATASRLCDRAVVGGYVVKNPSRADARRLSLALTPTGIALRSRSEAFRLAYLTSVLDHWTPDEVEVFERLLTRFAETVHSHPPAAHSGEGT